MKKLTLFLVASVMLSSTFLSASCEDDEDDVKIDEKVDEWLSDHALESDEFYNLYEYDETLVYSEENANVNPGSIKDNIDYNGKSVDAKAQILSTTNIDDFGTIEAMKKLVVVNEVDPNDPTLCLKAYQLLAKIEKGQVIAIDVNGKKIVAKAIELDKSKKSVHVKGYALFPKE